MEKFFAQKSLEKIEDNWCPRARKMLKKIENDMSPGPKNFGKYRHTLPPTFDPKIGGILILQLTAI